ncbi:hypothetical protein PV10_00629 [Exophiala mesophila]|uniref:aldehyde dehydrogenase (NAD(+)) n=1 Tax=Exophiala mesophila TaxID=212818 RepID=A0A0D2ACZ9_EXOME|nr:uncharacterized protein PV10_00629 [Exophiala mesophila]KIV96813.1 hypothetical protein PV10_00629 [Exophiala mesophila]
MVMDFTQFSNIVNGEARGGNAVYQGIDPTTRQKLWDVPVATRQDVDDAVQAAQEAFKSWSTTPIAKRKEICSKFGQLYQSHMQDFDFLIRKECGKPVSYNNLATGLLPDLTIEDEQRVMITQYVPMGVVAAICPWNCESSFLILGKIAPALVSGNCVIAKPSPFTPYGLLKLVELAQQVFPPGVLQVLGGDDSLGPWLTEHPGIQKISFTGSTATGKKVMQACSRTLKRLTLELGGNDASIICPDVDIAKVAPKVTDGAFRNSGQVCTATKRIYVHESIYPDFVVAMVKHAQTLKVGSSDLDDDVKLGPLQNEMQYLKVRDYFDDCLQNGFRFATGGLVKDSTGYFINPTIVDSPPADSRIVQEEQFGPIVPVLPWSDEEDVIHEANNSNTGLAACVWSSDIDRATRIASRIEAGSVFINSAESITPKAVFSGHKESGLGGEWGKTGLLGFCNVKVTHIFK